MDMKYNYSVLLDTSFFIRLLNSDDFLHTNAKDYFKYFLENEILLKVSTISIAEYCVKGRIDELPLRNLEIISFDSEHAIKTAEFADVLFTVNRVSEQKIYVSRHNHTLS